jgi:hypothetical protein
VGKSSLINEVFKEPLSVVEEHQTRATNINTEITSPHNPYFVAHDSEGYEPGEDEKFKVLRNFIIKRSKKHNFSDGLHAIWLCITTPFANGRIFERGDEEICSMRQLGVPVIIVFTKYDLLLTAAKRELMISGPVGNADILMKKTSDLAKKKFDDMCTPAFQQLAKHVPGRISYVCVSTKYPETFHHLINMTLKNVKMPKEPREDKTFVRRRSGIICRSNALGIDGDWDIAPTKDYDDSMVVALTMAHRVDIESKIAASISVGKRKYWKSLATGLYFSNVNLWGHLEVIHTDIVRVWNIRGMDEFLLGEDFRSWMTTVVQDLCDNELRQRPGRGSGNTAPLANLLSKISSGASPSPVAATPMAALVAAAKRGYGAYKESSQIVRCLMGYIVDLTIIMQAVRRISFQSSHGNHVDVACVEQEMDNFMDSQAKESIHASIRAFVKGGIPPGKESIISKIESLIYSNTNLPA